MVFVWYEQKLIFVCYALLKKYILRNTLMMTTEFNSDQNKLFLKSFKMKIRNEFMSLINCL